MKPEETPESSKRIVAGVNIVPGMDTSTLEIGAASHHALILIGNALEESLETSFQRFKK